LANLHDSKWKPHNCVYYDSLQGVGEQENISTITERRHLFRCMLCISLREWVGGGRERRRGAGKDLCCLLLGWEFLHNGVSLN